VKKGNNRISINDVSIAPGTRPGFDGEDFFHGGVEPQWTTNLPLASSIAPTPHF
jgi:hypothetical protein